jgi:hypothetical protein
MAAASNESQGLKIAVAVFVMFTVILAVTTYFGFSSYYQALEKQTEAEKTAQEKSKIAGDAVNTLAEVKKLAGFQKAGDDLPAITDAIKKSRSDQTTKVGAIQEAIKKAADEYKAAGGSQQKVDELTASGAQMFTGFTTEPNMSLASSIDRLLEILHNQALLTAAYAVDNEDLRSQLGMVNRVNNEQKNVAIAARDGAKSDLEKEHVDHNQMLTGLRAQLDKLQTDNNNQAQEIAKLKTQLTVNSENAAKTQTDLLNQMKFYRELVEKKETILDRANGHITYVDWQKLEVRTDLNRARGARPQMKFSVFDKAAPGLPTDKPKATIELIQVGDRDSVGRIITGHTDSLGRYTRDLDPMNPVRSGDQLYTPAFGSQRFALIGKIDIDRDGNDDREDLKRLIRQAGGVIDYDLPVHGAEVGKITGLTSWYVIDERPTWRPETASSRQQAGSEDKAFLDKKTEAIKLARLEGVRPISIKNLLAYLNYTFGAKEIGQIEAINREASERLLHPKGVKAPLPVPGAEPPAEGDAAKTEPKKDDGAAGKENEEMKKDPKD